MNPQHDDAFEVHTTQLLGLVQQRVVAELPPDEAIVWCSQPVAWRMALRSAVMPGCMLVSMLLVTLVVFALEEVLRLWAVRSEFLAVVFWVACAVSGLAFLLVLLAPATAWWRARRTGYVITDRRAVIVLAEGEVRSYPPELMQRVVRDYRKIATELVLRQFGTQVDPDELDELVCSVVNQWQRFDGNAGIFVDGQTGYYFQFVERGDGMCEAGTSPMRINVEAALQSSGVSQDALPEVITQLNLGQSVEFRNHHGVPSRLWLDPKARRICIEPLALTRPIGSPMPPLPPQSVNMMPPSGPYLANVTIPYWAERATQPMPTNDMPFSCPRCSAVLPPWREGQREQTCALCGFTISLS